MEIEQEIKQKVFRNEHQKVLVNILYTASSISLEMARVFKKYNLTPPQYNVLRILRGQYPNPATINLLISRMIDKSSNASRIVEKLRVKKLLKRITCPEDRRAVNVLITQKGLNLLAEMDKIEDEFGKGINHLTKKEAIILSGLLDKIRDKKTIE